MAAAAEWASQGFAEEQARQAVLRDRLRARHSRRRAEWRPEHRLANTLNVSFPGISSETLLMALDLEGVCASSGSACMVGSVVASHVLLAMGAPLEVARSAIRFSLGKQTAEAEIEAASDALGRVLARLKPREQAYAAV